MQKKIVKERGRDTQTNMAKFKKMYLPSHPAFQRIIILQSKKEMPEKKWILLLYRDKKESLLSRIF
jgi:hypothetical protein